VTYLLDTNVCIRYLNGRAPGVRERLQSLPPAEVVVCSVVKAELFAGAMKSTDPARTLARQLRFLSQFISLPFDDRAAEAYGRIRTQLETAGAPIGPYDLQIAAIAVSSGLILVTHNTREFGRVPDLALEDWEA
jgi:tRNA(fMet)-specific endonuclease VapC